MGLHLGLTLGNAQPVGPASSITIDTAPAITGTAEVGETLTRTVGSYSGDGTITVNNGRWTRNGADIAPAQTGATYTLDPADDQTTVRWYEDVADAGSGDTLESPSNGKYVTYAAPTAAGGLTDQSFTEDTGTQTYDVSGDFTNAAGGTWSLPTTIAGVTINSSGVVQVDTDTLALQTGTSIVARYTNSGGAADSGFSLTIAEDTTPALSATLDGEMEIDGSGDISLTVTAPSDYAGGPYTTDQSTAATGNLNTTSIETGPQCAVAPAISRTSGASDTVGAVYTRVSGLWLYDGDDTLTLAGEWYLDGVATGEAGATYTSDTAGDVDWRDSASGAGATRTAISNEITVAAAATAPAQMSAPTVTSTGETSISVDRAAAPSDGGSTITSYDLRHSTDESTWTTVTGISDPETISGLTASTLYYVQTRAVNAVGAGAWSASGTATTDAAATDPATALIAEWGSDLVALADMTDFANMWQDIAGTTAITAAGQNIQRFDDLSGNGNYLRVIGATYATSAVGHAEYNDAAYYYNSAVGYTSGMAIIALIDPDGDTEWPLMGKLSGPSHYTGLAADGSVGSSPDGGFAGTLTHAVENVDLSSPDRNDIYDAVAAEGGWVIQSSRGLDLTSETNLQPLAYSTGAFRFSGNVKYILLVKNVTAPKLAATQTILDGAK